MAVVRWQTQSLRFLLSRRVGCSMFVICGALVVVVEVEVWHSLSVYLTGCSMSNFCLYHYHYDDDSCR